MRSGVGDLQQAAKAIIRDEPPSAIRRFFPSTKEAVRFYAEARAQQFAARTASPECMCCEDAPSEVVAEFQWAALFGSLSFDKLDLLLIVLGHLGVPIKTEAIGFSSFHGFCSRCWGQSRRRKLVGRLLEAASALGLLVGLALGLGFGLAPVFSDGLKLSDKALLFACSAGGLLLILFSIYLGIRARAFGIPVALQHVAPRPFLLRSTQLMQVVSPPDGSTMILVPRYRPDQPGALSWQQSTSILLLVFVGLPTAIMAFGAQIEPKWRELGRLGFVVCVMLVITFWALHARCQRRIRAGYYRLAAERARRSRPA